MIFTFEALPKFIFEGNDILLATTKFGDIRFVDNMLIVPVSVDKSYCFDYTKLSWTMKWANIIYDVSAPQINVAELDLMVYNELFFELLLSVNDIIKNTYYRFVRHMHCFTIINRGKLWYDHLLPSQITELNEWYEAWLDITKTHCIPIEPKWLNDKLNKLEQEEIL